MRICNKWRRSPWALTRGNYRCVTGQTANRYPSTLRIKRRCSRQYWRRTGRVCRTALELSFAGAEGYLAGARSGFRSGCGQLQGAFQEQKRGQKRRARVGHHHCGRTCMGYRDYRCDCLPGLAPGGTLAIDLNDGGDFLVVVRARRFAVAAVASHACLP